ncbi:hypothetical protein [Rhodopseudomonas pseudopalustris]|uniref:hypothetical protein n=1 Tax=Rhodopseudomonas pseudopalustris TaxID=1513892 RepID=UPI0002FC2B82|nr:hypothetical protein [Rhodopseudomonas pseudopalustris]MBB1094026.1 hypothetical protein [Rhodopseudomonas palustris]
MSAAGGEARAAQSAAENAATAAPEPDIARNAPDERAEILKRIAAFRNLQVKLRQDREKYYDETLARTRKLLSQPMKPRR